MPPVAVVPDSGRAAQPAAQLAPSAWGYVRESGAETLVVGALAVAAMAPLALYLKAAYGSMSSEIVERGEQTMYAASRVWFTEDVEYDEAAFRAYGVLWALLNGLSYFPGLAAACLLYTSPSPRDS